MKKINLFDRYDGNCLVTYNSSKFYKNIYPHPKHVPKTDLTLFMLNGNPLPFDYLPLLNFIKKNPKKTQKDIAKALKKNKVYSELRLLNDLGFISAKGYPFVFEMTSKGLKELGEK